MSPLVSEFFDTIKHEDGVDLMKISNTIFAMMAFLLSVMGLQPVAQAALCRGTMHHHGPGYSHAHDNKINSENNTFSMNADSFYHYDPDVSRNATISSDTLTFPPQSDAYTPSVMGNVNNTGWHGFTGPLSLDYGNAESMQISFSLDPYSSNNEFVYAGSVAFQNNDAANLEAAGRDLFQALYAQCYRGPFSITISSSDDPVSSSVPIPASALLLFTGLAGLIGFRRRMINR
jgi:hypothetical protein